MDVQRFSVDCYPWEKDGYRPVTTVTLTRLEDGLAVRFVVREQAPRATFTEHNSLVYKDSCVEFFAQFDRCQDGRYMNFEMNANGALYCAINIPGGESTTLPLAAVESCRPGARVYEDRWEAWLTIPVQLVQEHFPGYQHRAGIRIRGNFYKCGDLTAQPHFGCWRPIEWPEPNFHRPEFFGDIWL